MRVLKLRRAIQWLMTAVVILIGAGLPSFFAEAKFSGDAFRLFRWRSPDTRMQMYLETVIAREDGVKEVKLFQLGPKLLPELPPLRGTLEWVQPAGKALYVSW